MALINRYLLLDGARLEGDLIRAKELNQTGRCLYMGESEKLLGTFAPWLLHLNEELDFADWLAENAPNNSWGIIIQAEDQEELYRHLRKFLLVQTEEGKELYFRFYDPRVLRIFLPTCDADQLNEFFGGIVEAFIMEDEDGQMLEFTLEHGELKRNKYAYDLRSFLLEDDAFRAGRAIPQEVPKVTEKSDRKQDGFWDFG